MLSTGGTRFGRAFWVPARPSVFNQGLEFRFHGSSRFMGKRIPDECHAAVRTALLMRIIDL